MTSNSSKIINIESNSQQVKIDFRYTNRHGFGGWVRINPNCFIRPAGSDLQYTLLEAHGIPIAPKSITFKRNGDILYYTLTFPALSEDIYEIDIIEEENDETSFNYYNIPLKIKAMTISNKKTYIIKKIETIALELKGDNKVQKNFSDEIERLDQLITELSAFLLLTKEETAIFCLCIYLSITTDSFSLNELKHHSNFNHFDLFEIKKIIKQLLKKGWISKGGSIGVHRSLRHSEEKTYVIHQNIVETLYNNNVPEIKKKEVDVYVAAEYLHICLRDHCEEEIDTDEMNDIIKDYEEEYADINPFKIAKDLNLSHTEKLLLYFAITKTSIGEEIIDVDRMLSHLFKERTEKLIIKKTLSKRASILFTEKYLEFVSEDFKTDKQLKLTKDAIEKIFGEDACFLSKEEDFSSGICKLIKCDSIPEKELFYNDQEQHSIDTLSEFLKIKKFNEIVKRLEENKMRPGLTILLHGYPGTGKTETIYQLARKTQRHIIFVNISEIRDKWVGESEKRLKSVFETYKNSFKHFEQTPILLFNESDALIGKRINVNTSVDQMNNSMQNILLQELEDFNGILMATTNLTSNLDEAFDRRFLYKIKYSKPSIDAKTSIWKSKLNYLSHEDVQRLAQEYDFSGGQIENISRKLFLDSVLLGKTYTIEETMKYCEEEILVNERHGNKIGF